MTPNEMLRWLDHGPMVQEGRAWVHENQAFWDQNPTLDMGDGTTARFDDWVMQGPMVTDGTSWMTENQFLWDHRFDPDQSPWLRMDDGTMVQLDQWLRQGPTVQGGVTENQFLWDHRGEDWVFVPDGNDSSTGNMVPFDQWLEQGPTVTAPDGTTTNLNRFLYEHRDDGVDWVVAPNGHLMSRSQLAQWGPPTTGPDGQTIPQGQYILDHPDDPHNPWVYFPFAPGDPYAAYLDPQYLDADGAGVSASAPLTATTLSDYKGRTALDITSMVGLAQDLTYQHRNAIGEALRTLVADMAGVEDALGFNEFGLRPSQALMSIRAMERIWRAIWENFVGNGDITNGKSGGWFAQVYVNMGTISEKLVGGAKGAHEGEQKTLESLRAAGYDIDTTMPEAPQVLMDEGRTGPG